MLEVKQLNHDRLGKPVETHHQHEILKTPHQTLDSHSGVLDENRSQVHYVLKLDRVNTWVHFTSLYRQIAPERVVLGSTLIDLRQ